MENQTLPTKKSTLKICADLKAHDKKVSVPQQRSVIKAEQCENNVCSLTDWKPSKKQAA